METATYNTQQFNDDFSPKRFLQQVSSIIRYLLSKWLIIVSVGIGFGILGAIYASSKNTTYQSEISFALEEEATQKAKNGFVEMGEELGLGSSSIDASGALFGRMTNIVELMQSRLLIEKTLRSTVTIYGKPIIFANFFLDSLDDYRNKWLKDAPYYNLKFNTNSDTIYQSGIIRNIHETLISKYIKITQKGKGTTLISVSCNTENELFSKYFLEKLVKEVTTFYTDIKTQRAKTNLAFIEKRMDSIRPAYSGALHGRAAFMDAHVNPVRQIAVVSTEKQQTDVQILKSSYIELSRSLEAAKIALVKDTPLIQYLDMPILPLKTTGGGSMVKYFLILFFLGVFVTAGFLFVKKVLTTIMNS